MEQDVDHGLSGYRRVCSACLSSDRNLTAISGFEAIYQVFRLLMYEFNEDRYGDALLDIEQLLCWECLALMRKFAKFRKQVQSAQEHLRVLAISQSPESIDHTYLSQSLSTLDKYIKCEYDCIYVDYTASEPVQEKWPQQYIQISGAQSVKSEGYDVAQSLADPIRLATEGQVLTVPEIVLENVTSLMPHMVVGPDLLQADASYTTEPVKGEISELIIDSVTTEATVILKPPAAPSKPEKPPAKLAYTTEFMSEEEMTAVREEAKKKVTYACSVFKCELCIIGFYTEQQVQDHFVTVHRARPGYSACKVCYVYVEDAKLHAHVQQHYTRYVCKLCAHTHTSEQLMAQHVGAHSAKPAPSALVKVDGGVPIGKSRKKKEKEVEKTEEESEAPKGNLRKLLSKTTIVGYKCLECDMFFKNTRGRKTHVARYHREGLQCDICKKRFVNRTTLATHLRLHEGPLPREECPICHKMVRTTQLKYHVQRHQNKERYECKDCNKVFLHLTTYQAHLKYSRAHADEAVLKYPCPMCNKGYPTKESMQDHFNYQHLGKTTHKCPICNKPMASRSSVEKHMARVHAEKKEKPRNHICTQCDKAFTDKKALNQHAVIHSGERPLTCDVCQQSFKQKASLYTHRKRVHKLAPAKRTVTYMETAEPRP